MLKIRSMAKADKPPRYAATQYDKTGKCAVWLTLYPDRLDIDDGEKRQSWPLSEVFAGQIGQGEAECIGIPARPDLRVFVANDVLAAVKLAIKGEPYTLPRPWHMPIAPVILFGFLGLCALIWLFFD
ncbi:MAG TPA: hypothetical protein ENJ42_05640 [Hellea balneolensis]|uniref:Uncharacterized protein n=1 Tax=Hellea balneolensis TaxID=287478 RepID=A0A7C5QPK2_9PROT|nr:hypothetical protein [Hellea balneolensis]